VSILSSQEAGVVLISSNDIAAQPEDAAACTPDFFLFDAEHTLVYRGQFDGSRPGNDEPVTGADLSTAVDAVLSGEPPLTDQQPSMGCNIKWRSGNEPAFFTLK
jgi:hypothetical protein